MRTRIEHRMSQREKPGFQCARAFFREFLSRSRPVVITGVADRWQAIARWDAAYFKRTLPEVEVRVEIWDRDGPRNDPADYLKSVKRKPMPLGEFLELLFPHAEHPPPAGHPEVSAPVLVDADHRVVEEPVLGRVLRKAAVLEAVETTAVRSGPQRCLIRLNESCRLTALPRFGTPRN